MNWLAHVFLSEPSTDFRLGNLLADLVRGADREGMPHDFLRGATCHKAIDAFTDSHPIVLASRRRLDPRYRRFSGVLIDIFYDYLLAQDWATYAARPLDEYTSAFYLDVRRRQLALPVDASATLARILQHDLLGQYRHLKGVEHSVRRISTYLAQRWGRQYHLEASIAELQTHEAALTADFAAFFPQLRAHVESQTF